jgi:DNA replication and repair protein RecF
VLFLYLQFLKLQNFRNYISKEVVWHPRLNIITGLNAQGKSNLLEAIYYLSIASSFRNSKDQDVVRWGQYFFYIEGAVNKKNGIYTISLGYSLDKRKVVKVNGNNQKKTGDILGILNTVMFSPEDLAIVKSSPVARRKYLDREIIQLFPTYYYTLSQYYKTVNQRNSLLKEIRENRRKENDLEIWDQQLVKFGSEILKKRLEVLKMLTPLARLMHRKITHGNEDLEVSYEAVEGEEILKSSTIKEINTILIDKLWKNRSNEINRGVSLIGPHRDDLKLLVNNVDVRKFGSQGQQRTTALSLKMAELEMMKAQTSEYPILLLDDVMSELDTERRNHFLDLIGEKVQTFLTVTDFDFSLKDAQKWLVDKGNLEKI